MELREYLSVLRKYWISISAVTLAGFAIGTVASFFMVVPVTATSAVFITVRDGETAREVLGGASYAANQVRSYMLVATTPLVLQPVIDELGLDVTPTELTEDSLSVTNPVSSTIIEISVEQKDPALATGIAQGVAEQLVRSVESLSPKDPGGERTVIATIITPAQVVTPEGGFSLAGVRMGLLVGLILGLGQALVRLLLDRSVSTARIAERVSGHATLAEIPFSPDPVEASSLEPYRRLRTNLAAVLANQPGRGRSFVVTSANAGEGKTTTAINLARAYAGAGESVLLIDANPRRPQVDERLGIRSEVGLTSVLSGRVSLGDAARPVDDSRLHVLSAGAGPGNPDDFVSSASMAQLMQNAVEEYDYVVVDVPALAEASDAASLAAISDGGLLVVGRKTNVDSLREAARTLQRAGAATLGVVLNRTAQR